MIKQRLTLFNPGESHDDVVGGIDKQEVILNPSPGFVLENKLRVPVTSPKSFIKEVRVQSRTTEYSTDESPAFNYFFGKGLHVYAAPLGVHTEEDKVTFYQQVGQLLHEWFQLEQPQEWIQNYNSVYYHNETSLESLDLPLEKELVYEGKNIIIDWHFTNDQITFKQLTQVDSKLVITQTEGTTKEIGLFLLDRKLTSSDDLAFTGLRVAMNEEDDEYVFKTLFHVKPRHRVLDATVISEVVPNGLHPVIQTTFSSPGKIIADDTDVKNCKLYYYINLQKSFIFDKYQSIPKGGELVISNGNSDLELPAYKVSEWGNEILFEFNQDHLEAEEQKIIEFSLHSRYQSPGNFEKHYNSAPQLFHACDSVKDAYLLSTSPFDNKLNIGGNYETYFTNDTVFYHYLDESSLIGVEVPSGTTNFARVESITAVALGLGVLYVLYKLLAALLGSKVSIEKKDQ